MKFDLVTFDKPTFGLAIGTSWAYWIYILVGRWNLGILKASYVADEEDTL